MSRIDDKYISNDIVLIDYGLSFSLDNPPSWLGTITNYRAPEAEFDGQISKACDIWALGCIIYELFTRRGFVPTRQIELQGLVTDGADPRAVPSEMVAVALRSGLSAPRSFP